MAGLMSSMRLDIVREVDDPIFDCGLVRLAVVRS